jgi:hypothetical protein
MAELTTQQRQAVRAAFTDEVSSDRETFAALTKDDIRAALDALDTFLHTNAATINAAIPQPARGALTAPQKARLLKLVITARYINGA